MNAKVLGGEEVKILTSGGEIDPNTYNVKFVKKDLVGLSCKETGMTFKVNNQRIYKIVKDKIMNNDDNTATMDETSTIEIPKIVENADLTIEPIKVKKVKKVKTPPEKIDFGAMVMDGREVWSKGGLSLGDDPKISQISVAAHCVIDAECEGYEVFNSYSGTRGVKGKGGKYYEFTEKMTIEKKRKTLAKKGYVKYEAQNNEISDEVDTPILLDEVMDDEAMDEAMDISQTTDIIENEAVESQE